MKKTIALLPGVALLLALPLATLAYEQKDAKADKAKRQDSSSQSDNTRSLGAFDLKHRKPAEIQHLLALRWEPSMTRLPTTPTSPGQVNQQSPAKRPAYALDSENSLLFVRGSEKQVDEVRELVEALDVAEDKLQKHEFGRMQVIPVRKDTAGQVGATLAKLKLEPQVVPMEKVALIVLCEQNSDARQKKTKQAEEIISKLGADKDLGETSDKREKPDNNKKGDKDN